MNLKKDHRKKYNTMRPHGTLVQELRKEEFILLDCIIFYKSLIKEVWFILYIVFSQAMVTTNSMTMFFK